MADWLFGSEFSGPATAALRATLASLGASVLLLLYTLELRVQRRIRERQRARVTAHWRAVIARAVTGAEDGAAETLPPHERSEFLRLWNYTRNMVEGAAADRLIVLANALDLREFVRGEVAQPTLGRRLAAIQALGHLRDRESFAELLAATDDENTLISITAAEALAEIDPPRGVTALIPKLALRRDWPRTHVFRMLQKAGSEVISEPLFRVIRAAGDEDAAYLLQYVENAEFDVRDAIATELLASRNDPNLLAAALKIAGGYAAMPRLDELLAHPAWYVRMQAAALLGRMGRVEDVGRLEKLLGDGEWWVRYRAARALVRLPTLQRTDLEAIRARLHDPYAHDILDQAMAEAGIR